MQVVKESHIYTDPVSEANCPKCGEALSVEGLAAFTSVECPKCSTVFQVPAQFGPFLLIELLGAGGMGGVYRARDEALKREVAIKVMLQSLGDDIDFVETFQREAQAAAKLNHPNIAQIYSFGQQYGQPYIVMELISHGSLEEMMKKRDGLDPATAIMIGEQIAEGLREAAEAGLVHGDVKPENILFDEEGNAKLVDFGLAGLSSGKDNEVWGTPFYIAPEKVRRQKSDFRSDIYSLGATLYHVIANKPPFDGADATAVVKARFQGPAAPLKAVCDKEIPPEVEALLQRMLEVDPAKRYPTYGSLMGDMKRYLSKAGPVSLKKSSRRIKIKGKDAVAFDRHLKKSTTGSIGEGGNGENGTEEEESVQARGCKKMVVVAVIIVVGLIALTGVVLGMKKMSEKKAEERKVAISVSNQNKALANGKKALEIAKRNAAKIKVRIPEAMKYADDAAKLVMVVLGEEVRAQMVPPEPERVKADGEEPRAEAEATAENAVAEGEVTNAVAVVSNAVDAAAGAVAEVAAEPQAEEIGAETAGAGLAEDAHPVVRSVRQMYLEAYAVKMAGEVADNVVSELEVSYEKLETLKKTPFSQKEMIGISNDMGTKVSSMSLIPEIKVIGGLLSNLKVTLKTVESELETLVVKKRQEKAEQERLARKAAAEAKRRAALEAHQEKVRNERDRVAAAEGECLDSIMNLRFSVAILKLKSVDDELETDEGELALMTARRRIKRIEEFHKYLAKSAADYKFAKGGVITASDETRLVVGKTSMFWRDFYKQRFLEAGFLITDQLNAAKDKMSLRQHTRLQTNAALFLNTFYADNPKAVGFAGKLAREAVQKFSADADTIKELLPQFFEE